MSGAPATSSLMVSLSHSAAAIGLCATPYSPILPIEHKLTLRGRHERSMPFAL